MGNRKEGAISHHAPCCVRALGHDEGTRAGLQQPSPGWPRRSGRDTFLPECGVDGELLPGGAASLRFCRQPRSCRSSWSSRRFRVGGAGTYHDEGVKAALTPRERAQVCFRDAAGPRPGTWPTSRADLGEPPRAPWGLRPSCRARGIAWLLKALRGRNHVLSLRSLGGSSLGSLSSNTPGSQRSRLLCPAPQATLSRRVHGSGFQRSRGRGSERDGPPLSRAELTSPGL